MSRRAMRPLDREAVRAANDAFYARHPERVGEDARRIPLDATSRRDREARSEWMDLYEELGGAVEEVGGSPRALAETVEPCCEDREATPTVDAEAAPDESADSSPVSMRPCPARLGPDDPTPDGWQDYHGNSSVFHCGYRGILEDVVPGDGRLQNECFYDEEGHLVDEAHPYADCGGSPNEFDSSENPWEHTFEDEGGIWERGWDAFWEARGRDMDQSGEWLEQQWNNLWD